MPSHVFTNSIFMGQVHEEAAGMMAMVTQLMHSSVYAVIWERNRTSALSPLPPLHTQSGAHFIGNYSCIYLD